MLSNKLTFSLTFIVMLAIAVIFTGVADAQLDISAVGTAGLNDDDFLVVAKDESSVEAGDNTDDGTNEDVVEQQLLPDLAHFFNTDVQIFGGTLEVMLLIGNPALIPVGTGSSVQLRSNNDTHVTNALGGTANPKPTVKWHDVVGTEIMWGHDSTPRDPADPDGIPATNSQDIANKQWIEIFNNSGGEITTRITGVGDQTGNLAGYAHIAFRFIPDQFLSNDEDPSNGPYYLAQLLSSEANGNQDPIGAEIAAIPTPGTEATGTTIAVPANGIPVSASAVYVVVDRISNVRYARWALPGSSGNTQLDATAGLTQTDSLESAYRRATLNTTRTDYAADPGFGDGTNQSQWLLSLRRRNIRGPYVATPGTSHVWESLARDITATKVPSDKIVINEFRNDLSDENDDWIELYNRSSDEININSWQLSYVTGAYAQEPSGGYFDLPDTKIPAGGYLLIVNKEPHDLSLNALGSSLAGGNGPEIKKVGDGKDGAKHKYHVDSSFAFPEDKKFFIVLRNKKPDFKNGESEDMYIEDVAGAAWVAKDVVLWATDTDTFKFNTDIWPLKGWVVQASSTEYWHVKSGDVAKYSSSDPEDYASRTHAWARKKYDANKWWHKDHWAQVGHQGGLGYDRNADLRYSPGTPGYSNDALNKKLDPSLASSTVTISEIMYDAGPNLDLVQWIELYNSSTTQAVDLTGWKLEIRNIDDENQNISPVDAVVPFSGSPRILPNQTLLIVSASVPVGFTNLGSANHIYNLAEKNRGDLNLRVRRDILLSEAGFYVALHQPEGTNPVDQAGNIGKGTKNETSTFEKPGRATPDLLWDLPAGIDNVNIQSRKSLTRLYGQYKVNLGEPQWGGIGESDMKNNGLYPAAEKTGPNGGLNRMHANSGWVIGHLGGKTYYGHPNDLGTPGFRRGGPLPVSLSSFRPVRDKATGEVVVRWATESELNNAGFNILRSETKNGQFKVVNVKGIVPGHGTTSEKHVYEWKDTTAKPNVVYYYQIEDVSFDGKRTTLTTTRLKGHVSAAGKVTTTWGDLKHRD